MTDLLDILPLFPEESEAAIYARMAAFANEGLTVEDVDQWVDTREGSHFQVWSQPYVRELARAYDLMGTEFLAAAIPITSWGEYLDSIAASYLIERLAATHAAGEVTFIGDVGLEIIAGARVGAEPTDSDEPAKEFEVTESGTIEEVLGAPEELESSTESTGGGLADGDHYYAVTTLNDEGESVPSTPLKVTLAVGGDGIVTVSWDAVPGATGYRLYHATSEGGSLAFVAEVTEATYKDDGSPAPDTTIHPPAEDTTGGRVTLAVEAVESGANGNANAGEVTVQVSSVTAESVVNQKSIAGGTDPETDEALLKRVQERFEGIGPGNIAAYRVWAGEYPGVGRVTVIPLWEGPGTVLIIALTATGDPVSPEVVEGLQAELDPVPGKGEGRAPIGHEVTVTTATAVEIDFEAEVEFEDGYSLDGAGGTVAMRDDLTAAIANYFEVCEPGGEVVRQKAIGRLMSFTGLHDIAGVKLNGGTINITLDDNPAQVAVLGEITLTEASL